MKGKGPKILWNPTASMDQKRYPDEHTHFEISASDMLSLWDFQLDVGLK